ncbi:hypothetical protein ACLOJK_041677 [Asimina triloba]
MALPENEQTAMRKNGASFEAAGLWVFGPVDRQILLAFVNRTFKGLFFLKFVQALPLPNKNFTAATKKDLYST